MGEANQKEESPPYLYGHATYYATSLGIRETKRK